MTAQQRITWRPLFPELTDAEFDAQIDLALASWTPPDVDFHVDEVDDDLPFAAQVADAFPFGDFFVALTRDLAAKFQRRLSGYEPMVDVAALTEATWEAVLEQCADTGVRTLTHELHRRRDADELIAEESALRFREFVLRLRDQSEWDQLWKRYPGLFRRIRQRSGWLFDMVADVVEHTCESRAELAKVFGGDPTSPITAVSGGQGDSHRQGRTVAVVTFADGLKIMHKPRSLAVEVAFNELVGELNERLGTTLQTPQVLTAEHHGWVQFLEHTEDTPDTTVFYQDMGILTGLLFLLNAWDVHYENVITWHGRPVVVDVETLFRPMVDAHNLLRTADVPVQFATQGDTAWLATQTLDQSVLAVGTLPMAVPGNDGTFIDIGALGFKRGQMTPFRGFAVRNAGRDDMYIERVHHVINEGAEHGAGAHEPDILRMRDGVMAGTRMILDWALENRDLVGRMFRQHLSGVRLRYLHNPTMFYTQILRMGTHPVFLTDELTTWVLSQRAVMREYDADPGFTRSEVRDLFWGDVPFFQYDSDGVQFYDSMDDVVGPTLPISPLDAAIERLGDLDRTEIDKQLEYMSTAFSRLLPDEFDNTGFAFPGVHEAALATPAKSAGFEGAGSDDAGLDVPRDAGMDARMLAEAVRIGDQLLDRVVTASDTSPVTWIAPIVGIPDGIDWVPGALGNDLYSGTAGIGLFLAALAGATGEQRYAGTAKQVLSALGNFLSDDEFDPAGVSPGAYTGVSGAVYAVAAGARQLGDEDLRGQAFAAIPKIAPTVMNDYGIDLYSGPFGMLASCLALARMSDGGERDVVIGHAMEALDAARPRLYQLIETGNIGEVGFARGIAGMTPYVLELAQITRDDRLQEFGERMLDALNAVWRAEFGRTRMIPADRTFSWCQGSAGVLLGTVLSSRFVPAGALNQQIAQLIDVTVRGGFGNNVSYCHGDLGSLEVLQLAAQQQQDTELATRVRRGYQVGFEKVLERYDDRLNSKYATGRNLMTGSAGIGYALLRQVSATPPPSVLWLE